MVTAKINSPVGLCASKGSALKAVNDMPDKVKMTRSESKYLQAELDLHGVAVVNGAYKCKCGATLPRSVIAAEEHFFEVAFIAGWKAHKASTSRKGPTTK